MSDPQKLSIDDPRWVAFVDAQPEATAFHRPSWSLALAASYGFEPFVFALLEGGGIVAGTPMTSVGGRRSQRWISLPFSDVCAPLGAPEPVRDLVAQLDLARLVAGVDLVELRGAVGESTGTPFDAGVVHTLELDGDIEDVRARLHPSLAGRNVKRSQREGVDVSFEATREAVVDTFYRLHVLTRRRQGIPVQPRRFFARLWEHVVAPGDGFVVVARVDGKPAASALFLRGGHTLTYKFGASDSALLFARPNHAVFWAAIEWAHRQGHARLDLGRSDRSNLGLRAFKSSWGATEHPLVYTALGRRPRPVRNRARLLRPLIARSPTMVCRILGETLYRRAA